MLGTLFAWGGLLGLPALALHFGPRLDSLALHATRPAALPGPRLLGWLTGLGWFGFFMAQHLCVSREAARVPAVALFGCFVLAALALLGTAYWLRGALTPRHRYALLAGTAWFWAIFGLIQQGDNAKRPDDTSGMALVGLAGLAAVYWLGWRMRREPSAAHPTPVPALDAGG
jgi:hypothetical protein